MCAVCSPIKKKKFNYLILTNFIIFTNITLILFNIILIFFLISKKAEYIQEKSCQKTRPSTGNHRDYTYLVKNIFVLFIMESNKLDVAKW